MRCGCRGRNQNQKTQDGIVNPLAHQATRVVAPQMVGLTISIVNFSGIFFAAILQVVPGVIIQGFHDTTLIALQVGHSVFVLGMVMALVATLCLPSHTQPERA